MQSIEILVEKIANLPNDWHGSGTVSRAMLDAIAKHAINLGPIKNTAETGSGKTTLLFSHLSSNHHVFSLDNTDSISVVKHSELFNSKNVKYIEGPTQKTLPGHTFSSKLEIVLIDGPHAFPFPELEYFYFYPNITEGGLLLIDDIQIPSIQNMFQIIKADDMFRLLEVVDYMAFFQRTDSPLFDPFGDSWWLQGYNRTYSEQDTKRLKLKSKIPSKIMENIPTPLKRWIRKLFY